MSEQPHTNIVHFHDPATVVLHEAENGRWFRVLNWFYDEVVPTLTCNPLKIMLGMMRYRDNATGLVARSRQQFADELKISKGGLSDAFTTLTTHPAGLLAIRGSSLFEPLPGRTFAGRIVVPGSVLPAVGSPQRTGVHSSEPRFAPPNRGFAPANPPSGDRSRARPPRLVVETEDQTAPAESIRRTAGWSGQTPWPELSLFGRMALERGDVRGVLEDLRVRPPALTDVMAIPGLTIDRVLAVAAEVAADPTAFSKPACLAGRLLGRKLARGVDARGRGRLTPDELPAILELQRLRDVRSRRPSHAHTNQETAP